MIEEIDLGKKSTGFPEYEKYEPSGAGKACRNDCVHA